MFQTRRDAWVISSLVILFLLQVGALLWHLGLLPGAVSDQESSQGQRAGRIVSIHNQLKQKSQGGLLWDETEAGRDVYFYDSLLTLKESEAILELENSTRIQVGESTLITIEPPDQNSPRDIFIQFSRGNLRARSDRDKTKLNDGSIQLQLSPGADVEFIKDDQNRGEVLVRSGQVELSDASGSKVLNKDQLALLVNGEWQEQQVSEELVWVEPPPRRIYSHLGEIPLKLNWQGSAEQLLVRDLKSGQQTSQKLSQDRASINLKQGSYRLRLKNGKLLSPALDIQIWQAPLVHLLTPLPRNREVFGPVSFLWTPLERSWTYQLRLNSLTSGEEVSRLDFDKNEATIPCRRRLIFFGRSGLKMPMAS
jgi:hypothetical protein